MKFNFMHLRKLRAERDQRILAIARSIDPYDRIAIDLYAQELANDICRAAWRDIAENYRQILAAEGKAEDVTELAETSLPPPADFRQCVRDVKKLLRQALRAIGKIKSSEAG
jgi:hypothetical protein